MSEGQKIELTPEQKQMIEQVANERIGAVVFMLIHAFELNDDNLDRVCERYGALRADLFQAIRILKKPENWEFAFEEWLTNEPNERGEKK